MLTSALASDAPAPSEAPSTRQVQFKSMPEMGGQLGAQRGRSDDCPRFVDRSERGQKVVGRGRPSALSLPPFSFFSCVETGDLTAPDLDVWRQSFPPPLLRWHPVSIWCTP